MVLSLLLFAALLVTLLPSLQQCLWWHNENSSSLFCFFSFLLFFRGSSESLDCLGTPADKAPRYVTRVMRFADQSGVTQGPALL